MYKLIFYSDFFKSINYVYKMNEMNYNFFIFLKYFYR